MTKIGWDDQGDSYTAWDRIRDENRAEQSARCSKGSCQRHGRCMYLNHPLCPLKDD